MYLLVSGTESARDCFKSAREIMDLVKSCQEWNALVETPIIGFAIYTVAFVGVYCINFPHMDPGGFMCTSRSSDTNGKADGSKLGESKGFEAARKALEMVGQMRPKLHMADGWFKTINRMHKYFRRIRSDYKKNVALMESSTNESAGSPVSTRHLSLREGGAGGGLSEFKLLERTLKEFGNLEDQDMEMMDVDHHQSTRLLEEGSNSGTSVKSEEPEKASGNNDPPRSDGGAWNAVNTNPAGEASRHPSASTSTEGQFRPFGTFQQQQQQQSQAPPPPPQPNYAHQINSFRPTNPQENYSVQGAPPGLTSPTSHSISPHSQPSPPFERQHSYPGWTPQNNTSYPMQPPQQAYTDQGLSSFSQHSTPNQTVGPYAAPGPQQQQQQQQHQMPPPPPHMQDHSHHNSWPMDKETWFQSVDTRFSGDDIAAFVDGGELAEWASMAANRGFGAGWLSAVWNGGAG